MMRVLLVVLASLAVAHGFTWPKMSLGWATGKWDVDTGGGKATGGSADTDKQAGTDLNQATGGGTAFEQNTDTGTTTYKAFCCCNAMSNATARTVACARTYAEAFVTIMAAVDVEAEAKAQASASATASAESYAEACAMAFAAAEAIAKAQASATIMAKAYYDLISTKGAGNSSYYAYLTAQQCAAAGAKAKSTAAAESKAYADAYGVSKQAQTDCDDDLDKAIDLAGAADKQMQHALEQNHASADAQAIATVEESKCKTQVI